MCHDSLFRIGEVGCITFSVWSIARNSKMKYPRLIAEVRFGLSARLKPICKRMPVIANTSANFQRGSTRNKPFQLDCIAHKDNGRYVTQKITPVRPKAIDQVCMFRRLVISPITPHIPEIINAVNATHTHAPCKYTIRMFVPRLCSAGPKLVSIAIARQVRMKQLHPTMGLSSVLLRFFSACLTLLPIKYL